MSKFLILISFILACLLVGFLGSIFTISSIPTWYSFLNKPFFSPPNWLFAPVWTTLYILMGTSAFIIFDKGLNKKNIKDALKIFLFQLFLNAIWTPIFFGAKNISLAFVVIAALWVVIVATIKSFSKINKWAGYMLYPYLAWVSFASILNFSLLLLN